MDEVLLTKVIAVLAYPLGLFMILLLLRWLAQGLAWRRIAVLLGLLASSVLLLASLPLVANRLAGSLEQQFPQLPIDQIARHDAIVVLGGGLRPPQRPAQHIQIGAGSDRYWYAARLYKAGKAPRIIVAGGNVFQQPDVRGEAHYAATLLQDWGIPADSIAIEPASRTTEQNMRNTVSYLQSRGMASVLLVTSAIHMPRAYHLFRSGPVSVTPASADVLVRDSYVPTILNWLPSARALQLTTAAMHEYYGLWFTNLKQLMERD